jgi:SAM-dependent methyltransferase
MQLPALFGLWAGHHNAGTGSGELAERYAALAERQSETGPHLVVSRARRKSCRTGSNRCRPNDATENCASKGASADGGRNSMPPVLEREVPRKSWSRKRAFDLGCGNGATCDMLSKQGFDVVGVDPSSSGIEHAKGAFPQVTCEVGSAYDDLASRYGTFDLVVSLEVIEHCMEPRAFARAPDCRAHPQRHERRSRQRAKAWPTGARPRQAQRRAAARKNGPHAHTGRKTNRSRPLNRLSRNPTPGAFRVAFLNRCYDCLCVGGCFVEY